MTKNSSQTKRKAVLLLEDGSMFQGRSFGYNSESLGEVVFNTALTGYEEIITDPSYCGQIVAMCYPHIGNYGINFADAESHRVWVEGLVVSESSKIVSNFRAKTSLPQYLKDNRITAIEGIDTRALVRKLRKRGAMKGLISTRCFDKDKLMVKLQAFPSISSQDLVGRVSRSKYSAFRMHKPSIKGISPKVVLIDYGAKLNIIKMLTDAGFEVDVLDHLTDLEHVLMHEPSAVLLSNGPGDPVNALYGIKLAKELIKYNKDHYLPVMGICLGHQLIALGSGARTYKLKFGHHGGNHPVKDLRSSKIEITAQNHNYCVDPDTLKSGFEITHINLNDGTVEGMAHKTRPVFSYQYHPEGCPGPHDSHYLFRQFRETVDG